MAKARPRYGKAPGDRKFQDALRAVVRFLDSSRKPSAIIGGVAVIAHGFARLTVDIDASLAAEPNQIVHLLRMASRFSLRPRIPDAEAFARENLVVLLEHTPTKTPIDVSLALQPFEIEAARSAEVVNFAGVSIRVPSLTALLVYKMLAARPQDLQDAAALIAAKRPFDRKRVEALLAEFDSILDSDRLGEFKRLLSNLE